MTRRNEDVCNVIVECIHRGFIYKIKARQWVKKAWRKFFLRKWNKPFFIPSILPTSISTHFILFLQEQLAILLFLSVGENGDGMKEREAQKIFPFHFFMVIGFH